MGRIKTQLVKRVGKEIYETHQDEIKKDFESNKALVTKFAEINSRKIRNIIAGYVTRLAKSRR